MDVLTPCELETLTAGLYDPLAVPIANEADLDGQGLADVPSLKAYGSGSARLRRRCHLGGRVLPKGATFRAESGGYRTCVRHHVEGMTLFRAGVHDPYHRRVTGPLRGIPQGL